VAWIERWGSLVDRIYFSIYNYIYYNITYIEKNDFTKSVTEGKFNGDFLMRLSTPSLPYNMSGYATAIEYDLSLLLSFKCHT